MGFKTIPRIQYHYIMKTSSKVLFALAGMFVAGAFSSCTTNVTTPETTTGISTTSTTTSREIPYSGSSTIQRKTTTTQQY